MFKINAGEVIEVPARQLAQQRSAPRVAARPAAAPAQPKEEPAIAPPVQEPAAEQAPVRAPARPPRSRTRRRAPGGRGRHGARAWRRRPHPRTRNCARRLHRRLVDRRSRTTIGNLSDAGRSGKWVGMRGYIHLLASAALAALLAGCSATGHNFDPQTLDPDAGEDHAGRGLARSPRRPTSTTNRPTAPSWRSGPSRSPLSRTASTAARKRCCSSALMAACCASWTAPIFCWNLGSVRSCWDRRRLRKTIRSRLLPRHRPRCKRSRYRCPRRRPSPCARAGPPSPDIPRMTPRPGRGASRPDGLSVAGRAFLV